MAQSAVGVGGSGHLLPRRVARPAGGPRGGLAGVAGLATPVWHLRVGVTRGAVLERRRLRVVAGVAALGGAVDERGLRRGVSR
jgi:hypothetical protein